MPKPRIPNARKANLDHKNRIERYCLLIRKIYDSVSAEGARITSLVDHHPGSPFSFDDYPLAKTAFEKIIHRMKQELTATIMAATSQEWKQSNLIQDMVANKVLSAYVGKDRDGDRFIRYFQTNPDALMAFQQRRIAGMNLSDRVWNITEQFKPELERAITAAIAPGMSAQNLSMEIREFLNEPDLMFRRFRYKDEDGRWKRKWKRKVKDLQGNVRFVDCDRESYKNDWTGPGYYKSSAKNALRLARTEINMAYRTAEQQRWRQFDFVVGYEVKTTLNGHHVTDICDRLAGKYPKDFHFTGWHPQCMCYAVPILKTEDEFWDYDEDEPETSVNEVSDVPQQFKEWVEENKARIEKAQEEAKNLPYFISDNKEYVEEALKTEVENVNSLKENYRGNLFARILDNIQTKLISNHFNGITSYEELSAKASNLISKAVGNEVEVTINPLLMPIDIAKAHLTELISITKDYNLKQGKLTEIKLGYNPKDKDEYGKTSYSPSKNEKKISLTSFLDSRDSINAINNSRCDKNRLSFSLASHEGAHLLLSFNSPLNGELNIVKHQIEQIWKDYQKEFNSFTLKGDMKKASEIMIGLYGHYKPSEFMAECFQEYRNSSNPSKYAIKIGKLLNSFFKK